MKKVLSIIAVGFTLFSDGCAKVEIGNEGFRRPDYPYFAAYVENGEILSQKTTFQCSEEFEIPVESSYLIGGEGVFVYPVLADMAELEKVRLTVDGAEVTPEIYYGGKAYYSEGGYAEGDFESYSSKIGEEFGTTYIFEPTDEALEISFDRMAGQGVFYGEFNRRGAGIEGYSIGLDDNSQMPYEIFVTSGELKNLASTANYRTEKTSHKEFVDKYAAEIFEEEGERARDRIYAQFNKCKEGGFFEWDCLLENYSSKILCLLKVAFSGEGEKEIVINSFVEPNVNGYYEPNVYKVRFINSKAGDMAHGVEIKRSEKYKYLLQTDMELNGKCEGQVRGDGYFLVSAKKPSSSRGLLLSFRM